MPQNDELLASSLEEAIETGKLASLGTIYNKAMEIKTEEEASIYLQKIVQYMFMHNENQRSEEELRQIALSNIGYWTGYYDGDVARRVFRLFKTGHPVFGKRRLPPEEVFETGIKLAKENEPKQAD